MELTLERGILTLSGEREEQRSDKRGEDPLNLRTERGQGHFYRRFVLPDTVDSEKVNASGKKRGSDPDRSEAGQGDAAAH